MERIANTFPLEPTIHGGSQFESDYASCNFDSARVGSS